LISSNSSFSSSLITWFLSENCYITATHHSLFIMTSGP
jgi:hypothetical protein